MNQLAIADRRQLRRKLGFWRIFSILLIVAAGFATAFFLTRDEGANTGSDHVARISISGLIQDDRELVERLGRIEKNDAVKALIVTISSPGGTTYGGETIYKAIRKVSAKKPVVSDIRTLAASAGYMIAIAGDTIVAGETSITGSIGVIFQYPQVKPLLDKLGVSLDEIKSAPLKAEPSPFHPASDEAKAMIQALVNDTYDWFIDLVVERRKLPRAEVIRLADGTIFSGRQALKAKLVDTLGGEEEIRSYLATRKVPAELEIVDWEAPRRSVPFWFGSSISDLLKILGNGVFPGALNLETGGADKLFLDGLVSVWQVGGR
ncbi:signal peptide peptidase SppA [Pararhizobium sp.]|uniref:signal peptide peptidase SppA n=1 Tax=Pararhizobium sp. TaxID=1977563 RepID=UPI002728DBD7|nr:signal peptide peptidase SppA [Pararhizobium sp.]MDO9417718.1 signal peptide peptidase SppA [Pararhizobium sp.]